MGYFDGLTDAAFKEDEQGNSVFYPFGILGKGKVIPNVEAKQSIRNLLKRYYQIFFPIMVLTGIIVGWVWAFAVAICSMVPLYVLIFQKTKNYEVATSSLKFSESARNSARSHNRGTLWVLFLTSIVFTLGGVLMAVVESESRIVGGLCAVFFGLCSYSIGRMIRLKDN